MKRREFLAAVPALWFAPVMPRTLSPRALRVALVYSPEFGNAARAAKMSAGEVQRAASLLKREFHFTAIEAGEYDGQKGDWTGLILATPASAISTIDPTINIGSLACGANMLTLRSPSCRAGCVLWHESLERFGAGQLNDRFKAAGIPIDEQAWLGWFAVKVLWEAGARGKHPRDLAYDGHKGMALRFNQHGVLVQPSYQVSADRRVTDVRPDATMENASCGS